MHIPLSIWTGVIDQDVSFNVHVNSHSFSYPYLSEFSIIFSLKLFSPCVTSVLYVDEKWVDSNKMHAWEAFVIHCIFQYFPMYTLYVYSFFFVEAVFSLYLRRSLQSSFKFLVPSRLACWRTVYCLGNIRVKWIFHWFFSDFLLILSNFRRLLICKLHCLFLSFLLASILSSTST